ncbi:ATP-binding protein [Shewanella sp. AS16]|uniref:ATP-binding protein n=1 Tax=Shewanella sp. AS16 TaxID=2907625 RepID=UPI001F48D956|nr:ATP-binding protein [Shewanella sp. AS16]MCE9686783.1 ATP-binding protein [Shewanella sp. AS16]
MLLCGLFVTLKLTLWFHQQQGQAAIQAQSRQQLSELIDFYDAVLARYANIPHVMSGNPLLAQTLLGNDELQVQRVNDYFEEMQQATEASDIYLLDAKGTAIAASNWQQGYSFIGQNYGFRPYYREAIKGKTGRYYAVGTASNKRGFYFSYPIYHQDKVLGVIVVKVDITDIEKQSTGIATAGQYEFIVTDPEQVVFLSSIAQWRLGSLVPLTQARQTALTASRRYANRPIAELDVLPEYRPGTDERVSFYRLKLGQQWPRFMETQGAMSSAGWRVHILAPLAPLQQSLAPQLWLAASLYLLVALALLFGAERRRNLQRMQLAQSWLEQRVAERTRELQATNQQLKDTQDQLIQAAKLTAIGSLSASINHELNQPLAALRSYAQNTQTFLGRNLLDKAADNIRIMIELTDRLADIIGQFKSFTRKSQGTEGAVDLGQCIQQALTIVQPEIDKQGIMLTLESAPGRYLIWGDKVRLQQVLVNLMSNAIVAMQLSHPKRLAIRVWAGEKFHISIQDTGPGVRESQMEKIFEPYFTTNERQGLGLGLSISRRIMEAMKGQITVANAAEGGAIFQLILPIFSREEAPQP